MGIVALAPQYNSAAMPPATPPKRRPRVRVGVAIYDGERILLVKYEDEFGLWWVLPGGGLHWGEGLHDGAVRECREEVCLDVTPGRVICVTEGIPEDAEHHTLHVVFRATAWSGDPQVGVDPRVHGIAWRKVTELRGLALYPPIAHVLAANAYGEAEQAPFIDWAAAAWTELRATERKMRGDRTS